MTVASMNNRKSVFLASKIHNTVTYHERVQSQTRRDLYVIMCICGNITRWPEKVLRDRIESACRNIR